MNAPIQEPDASSLGRSLSRRKQKKRSPERRNCRRPTALWLRRCSAARAVSLVHLTVRTSP
jgi:hypothetical protein